MVCENQRNPAHLFFHRGVLSEGGKMGPNYACLFVEYVEEQISQQYTGCVPQLHKRYIDDVVVAACCSFPQLEEYIAFVSDFHPALQFTRTISGYQSACFWRPHLYFHSLQTN